MKLAPKLYSLHRALAWLVSIPVLCWTASGVSHPVMTWLSPHPAHQVYEPVLDPAKLAVPPQEALAKAAIPRVHGLDVVAFEGKHFHRVLTCCGERAYFDAATGAPADEQDEKYAVFLARRFANDAASPVKSISVVDRFDGEYVRVFQLLPVYRVEFDRPDGMRVYVDTSTSRLGAMVDARRGFLLTFFQQFHNFELLGLNESTRILVVAAFSAFVFAVAASGVLLYGVSFRRFWAQSGPAAGQAAQRRRHRTLGLAASAAMFLFSASGFYHVVSKWNAEIPAAAPLPPQLKLDASSLSPADLMNKAFAASGPDAGKEKEVVSLRLVSLEQGLHWRIGWQEKKNPVRTVNENPAVYIHASRGEILADGEKEHAVQLACRAAETSRGQVKGTERLTKFFREYAAIYKRLPVTKVQLPGEKLPRYYVDTAADQIAVRLDDVGKWERMSFLFLHKWHFLDSLGHGTRDGIMVAVNALAAAAAILGMTLLVRRRAAKPAAPLAEVVSPSTEGGAAGPAPPAE